MAIQKMIKYKQNYKETRKLVGFVSSWSIGRLKINFEIGIESRGPWLANREI
jgi:hypothetical protein